jgi:hypothetical protein
MTPTYLSPSKRAADYVRNHKLSLAIFLAAYGVFYLAVVIMGGWSPSDWGKDIFDCSPWATDSLLPRSYISPIFFVTSLPALLIGATMLCVMSIKKLRSGAAIDQYVAIALVVFGFGYLIVGAWPLQTVVDMPWTWQKQIMSFGAGFGWMLYALGVIVLFIGAVSMYVHSREYGMRHPEFSVPE